MKKNQLTYPPCVRVTVPVTPEVFEVFKRLAKVSRVATGRAMGDWLGDTIDAALFMADTMEKARAAPRVVAQELHAYALGLGDETGELLQQIRAAGAARGRAGHAPAGPGAGPGGALPASTADQETPSQTPNPQRGQP